MGRSWLIDQVDSILNDENNSCGYLVLEAHAGLGKTAFLAWLVKERNYIHHFVELAPGQEGIEKGLRNLAAQIILAYKLSADEAIPDAAGRPDYLYRLLFQTAEKRGPGERIVVVVDALDEAGTPPNQNVLGYTSYKRCGEMVALVLSNTFPAGLSLGNTLFSDFALF